MPDYSCRDCGCTFDKEEGASALEQVCPDCGSGRWGLIRQSCGVGVSGLSTDWAHENNGKGRRIAQLDHGIRKPYYAKNQQAAIDEGRRRGLEVTKA